MEVTIVGGGIYGCLVAWELARDGVQVELYESGQIAGGASGGLGKRGVRANGRDIRELPLMELAYALWPKLSDEIAAPTGYERIGHLLLIERARDLDSAPVQVSVQEGHGIPTRLLGKDKLKELEPSLSDQVVAAIHSPMDGVADHTATTRGVAAAAKKLGAQINENRSVMVLETKRDRVSAVLVAEEGRVPISGELLLLANNGVPPLLSKHFGIELPVWSALPQVILTERGDTMPVRHLVGHAHRVLSLKSTADGRVMISGGWRGKWNAARKLGETIPSQVAGNLAEARAVYPRLGGVEIEAAKADRWETISYDGIPIIDRVPGISNAFFAVGWSGHGWAIAPAVARLLAQWVQEGNPPHLLRPFSLARYEGIV